MDKIDHIPFKWAEFLWDDDQDDHVLIYVEFIECLLFARLAVCCRGHEYFLSPYSGGEKKWERLMKAPFFQKSSLSVQSKEN